MRATLKKSQRVLAVLAAGSMLLAACGDTDGGAADDNGSAGAGGEADDVDGFPDDTVTIVVPAGEGGGMDLTGRRLQQALQTSLGTNVNVENHSGAGTTIGITYFLENLPQADECYGLILTNHPSLYIAPELFEDVGFTFEDLRPIGIPASNPGMWVVREDAPWETLEELIEDARGRPGEIIMSSSSASLNNHAIGVYEVMDETGVEFNIVPFADGGSAAREALVRGEVDFSHVGAFNNLAILDQTRVLAVQEPQNDWPDITQDAPTVNEILGTDLGPSGSFYGLQVHTACYENHPERFDVLVEAYQDAVFGDTYQQALAEVDEEGTVIDIEPDAMWEESQERAVTELEFLERYGDRFEE